MTAFIFVPTLVACVLTGFLFAIFASQYYLNVLQSTGSGARGVVWVHEPLVDNFWKVFYMAFLIVLWLGPGWLLGRAFASGAGQPWLKYAVPLAVFWIAFPVSQMSSLSGPSIWLPLHHDVFGRLARRPGVTLGFFLLSAPVLALFGLGFHLTFHADGFVFLFVGSPLVILAALLYARLLGRLAYVLMYTRSILSRRKKKKPRAEQPVKEEQPNEEPVFVQPSELPPIETPDEGPLTGYDIRFDEPARKRVRAQSVSERSEPKRVPPRPKFDDDDDTPYRVNEPEVAPEERAPPEVVKPSELEMKLLNRDDAPKPPKQVWTPELFGFLLQPDSISIFGLLTLLLVLAGACVRLAKAFNPVAGDG
jgi:hypothetical protein